MFGFKLAQLALVLEAAGIGALFAPLEAPGQLALYFGAHGGASLLVALVMTRFLPHFYPQTRRSTFGYFAILAFLVPVLGVVGPILLMLSARNVPSGERRGLIQLVEPLHYAGAPEHAPVFNRAGIRPVLNSRSAPVDLKLKALLALQSVPSRAANNLIREMLREPVDDMRLLAYGLLDAREKALDARIHGLQVRLGNAVADAERAPILRELAESYWELVYRGIVQGDLLQHAIGEARRFLAAFLECAPDDPGAWALNGRLLTHERRDAEADAAFARAIALGLPESRVLPYRAELAYRARDYPRVRALMREVGRQPTNALMSVIRYWNRDDTAAG